MYQVQIGFNVVLQPKESWPGRVLEFADGIREARCEPGDVLGALPSATAVDFLMEIGALSIIEDPEEEVIDG